MHFFTPQLTSTQAEHNALLEHLSAMKTDTFTTTNVCFGLPVNRQKLSPSAKEAPNSRSAKDSARVLATTALLLGLYVLCGTALLADGQAVKSAAAPPPASAPEQRIQKLPWRGSLGGGIQLESGRTNGRGIMISGELAKKLTEEHLLEFDGQLNHSTFKAAGGPRTVAAHNMLFGGQWSRPLNKRFFIADRFILTRDTVLGINDREFNASGIGVNLIASPKGNLYIVPAFGLGAQTTSVERINGLAMGFAAYEKFEYKLSEHWGISQWANLRTNKEHTADRSAKVHFELTAPALHKRVFLSFSGDYTYEGILSPQAMLVGATRNDIVFSVKLNYRIGN